VFFRYGLMALRLNGLIDNWTLRDQLDELLSRPEGQFHRKGTDGLYGGQHYITVDFTDLLCNTWDNLTTQRINQTPVKLTSTQQLVMLSRAAAPQLLAAEPSCGLQCCLCAKQQQQQQRHAAALLYCRITQQQCPCFIQ
jgi:hypothetical protein